MKKDGFYQENKYQFEITFYENVYDIMIKI